MRYYDPMFYISSEEMPFSIRVEIRMKDPIDPEALAGAVRETMKRYSYFSVQVEREGEDLVLAPNARPVVVYGGEEILPLGSEAVNRHLVAVNYRGSEMNLMISHIITDGGGFYPFMKTLLYYYITKAYGKAIDAKGIYLAEDPMYPDETGNPFPEEDMKGAEPLWQNRNQPFFRLRDGGYVKDTKKTIYRLRINEAQAMQFNFDNDGSPCAMVSALLARAIWAVHPEETRDLVSAVSFNLRPGLRAGRNHHMLSNALQLHYPNRLRDVNVTRLCTCTRGMITLQSQPENVLYYAEQQRKRVQEALERLPDAQSRREWFGRAALEDSVNNTFNVSYVGKFGNPDIESRMETMYAVTDGATWQSVFLEISAISGWFDISFLQGFSSDVYYRAFLEQLEMHGLGYITDETGPMNSPKLILP